MQLLYCFFEVVDFNLILEDMNFIVEELVDSEYSDINYSREEEF